MPILFALTQPYGVDFQSLRRSFEPVDVNIGQLMTDIEKALKRVGVLDTEITAITQ